MFFRDTCRLNVITRNQALRCHPKYLRRSVSFEPSFAIFATHSAFTKASSLRDYYYGLNCFQGGPEIHARTKLHCKCSTAIPFELSPDMSEFRAVICHLFNPSYFKVANHKRVIATACPLSQEVQGYILELNYQYDLKRGHLI